MLRKLKDILLAMLLRHELDHIEVNNVRESKAYKRWHELFTELGQHLPGYQHRYEIMITVCNTLIGRSLSLDVFLQDMIMQGYFEDGGVLEIGGKRRRKSRPVLVENTRKASNS